MGNEGERAARLPFPALCAENRVYKRRLQCVKSEQGSREQGGVDSSPAERAAGIRQEKAGQKWPDGEARPPKKRILTRACRNYPFTAVLDAFITVYKLAAGKLPAWGFFALQGQFWGCDESEGESRMKRTQQTSIDALAEAIEQQKNARDFNFINDLKMLRKQYTKTSKRDFLALLDLLREKYTVEETAAVHAVLMRKCQAGDMDAIRLWTELQRENSGRAAEVNIVDSI